MNQNATSKSAMGIKEPEPQSQPDVNMANNVYAVKKSQIENGSLTSSDKMDTAYKRVLEGVVLVILVIVLMLLGASIGSKEKGKTSIQQRDLSTPSKRLAGHWRNLEENCDIYYTPVDSDLKTGTYRLAKPGAVGGPPAWYKVISENSSKNTVIIRDFRNMNELESMTGLDFSKSDIVCCISKDGQSMTQEYIFMGRRTFSVYRYVDEKTTP